MKLEGVDLVYTWVNGDFPGYHEECLQYSQYEKDLNPERFRDVYSLLKYSLRSVEAYLNWYDTIYLVTKRPQVPDWLNPSHPRIKLVYHDQFIDNRFLPTFNPNCIESFLHRIPGLQDHFLYVNDDYLFGRETLPEDFMAGGRYRIFNTLIGENLTWRIYDGKNDLIGLGLIEHTPLLINKSYWQEMVEEMPEKMEQTRRNRFRKPGDLMTYKLYRSYMLRCRRRLSNPVNLWQLLGINRFHKITNNARAQKKALASLEKARPKFYCLNDDQRNHPNLQVVDMVKDFLNRMYPDKSSFER